MSQQSYLRYGAIVILAMFVMVFFIASREVAKERIDQFELEFDLHLKIGPAETEETQSELEKISIEPKPTNPAFQGFDEGEALIEPAHFFQIAAGPYGYYQESDVTTVILPSGFCGHMFGNASTTPESYIGTYSSRLEYAQSALSRHLYLKKFDDFADCLIYVEDVRQIPEKWVNDILDSHLMFTWDQSAEYRIETSNYLDDRGEIVKMYELVSQITNEPIFITFDYKWPDQIVFQKIKKDL